VAVARLDERPVRQEQRDRDEPEQQRGPLVALHREAAEQGNRRGDGDQRHAAEGLRQAAPGGRVVVDGDRGGHQDEGDGVRDDHGDIAGHPGGHVEVVGAAAERHEGHRRDGGLHPEGGHVEAELEPALPAQQHQAGRAAGDPYGDRHRRVDAEQRQHHRDLGQAHGVPAPADPQVDGEALGHREQQHEDGEPRQVEGVPGQGEPAYGRQHAEDDQRGHAHRAAQHPDPAARPGPRQPPPPGRPDGLSGCVHRSPNIQPVTPTCRFTAY
jgi:hypothetical protein